jgi:hypothetical protein
MIHELVIDKLSNMFDHVDKKNYWLKYLIFPYILFINQFYTTTNKSFNLY